MIVGQRGIGNIWDNIPLLPQITEKICVPAIVRLSGDSSIGGLALIPECWAILALLAGLSIYYVVKD